VFSVIPLLVGCWGDVCERDCDGEGEGESKRDGDGDGDSELTGSTSTESTLYIVDGVLFFILLRISAIVLGERVGKNVD
jgi:hypothetical protein